MNKIKAILRFLFVIVPFFVLGGLELIILFDKKIMLYSYETKKIKKKRLSTDRKLFAQFMKRVTK